MRQSLSLLLLTIIILAGASIYAESPASDSDINIRKEASSLQIPFIQNEGQIASDDVRFYTKLFNGTVFITDKGDLVYRVLYPKDYIGADAITACFENDILLSRNNLDFAEASPAQYVSETIRETFVTNPDKSGINVRGLSRAQTYVNYIIIDSPKNSRDNIPTYNLISLGEAWKGVTVNLKANPKNIEKLFIISPAGNPESIKISLDGAEQISLNESGELEIKTLKGVINFTRPFAYQETANEKKPVEVSYRLINKTTYGFIVGNYDKTIPLIIDPLLASTYIGGTSADVSNGIAKDTAGNVFIVGYTGSGYPTTAGVYQASYTFATDAFVSKFNSDISALLASTFIGSQSFRSEYGYALTIDSSGNVFVTGAVGTSTATPGSPATAGAYDTTFNGSGASGWDAFVAKLNNNLTSAGFAFTFLGGTGDDRGYGIATDRNNNVFVCGLTTSSNFPAVGGPYTTYGGGTQEGFVARFNNNLTTAGFASTFLGGSQADICFGIATDSADNVIVTGGTLSPDFPTVPLVAQIGSSDVFVTKFTNSLTSTLYSTRFGGTLYDVGYGIAVGRANNIHITGETNSLNFPISFTGGSTIFVGVIDAFVTKLSPSLNIIGSRYMGGSGSDIGWSIAVAPFAGQIYLTGYTASLNFPIYPANPLPVDNTIGGTSDIFVARLDSELILVASTYLGGSGAESGTTVPGRAGITADNSGNMLVTAVTTSSDFPLSNPITTPYNGSAYTAAGDIFVCRITPNLRSGTAATTSALAEPIISFPLNLSPNVANPPILQWLAPSNALGTITYWVYLSTDAYPLTLIYTGPDSTYVPSVNYETSYYWYIVASDGSGRVSWTPVYQFIVEVDPLLTSGSSGGMLFGPDAFTKPLGQCFIATAVYGSPTHPNVLTLKKFRDNRLLTNHAGRHLVRWYYKISPPIAEHLKHSPFQASLVKTALSPIVYTIRYPVLTAIAVIILMLLSGWLLALKLRRNATFQA
ncbi:MAG: SBBP repeat-containing protein [Planctomycetes bacterium]|nr:SBBP repeat-containing protein [Planctomycetota bacterium]